MRAKSNQYFLSPSKWRYEVKWKQSEEPTVNSIFKGSIINCPSKLLYQEFFFLALLINSARYSNGGRVRAISSNVNISGNTTFKEGVGRGGCRLSLTFISYSGSRVLNWKQSWTLTRSQSIDIGLGCCFLFAVLCFLSLPSTFVAMIVLTFLSFLQLPLGFLYGFWQVIQKLVPECSWAVIHSQPWHTCRCHPPCEAVWWKPGCCCIYLSWYSFPDFPRDCQLPHSNQK